MSYKVTQMTPRFQDSPNTLLSVMRGLPSLRDITPFTVTQCFNHNPLHWGLCICSVSHNDHSRCINLAQNTVGRRPLIQDHPYVPEIGVLQQ
jgi:hypothetical protein